MSDAYLTPKKTPLQWAVTNLSDSAFKTFMALFSHANDIGTCFPGYRLLAEMGRHELACVWEEMQEIMALDLTREIQPARRDGYGRWTPALYQINPNFMFLRADKFDEAMALWQSIEQTIEQKVPVGISPSKVSIESAESAIANSFSESAPANSYSKQQQQPDFSSKVEQGSMNAGQIAAWQSQRAAPRAEPENTTPQVQREAQDSAVRRTKTPPVPASPLKYEPLKPIPVALPDEDEALAQRIRDDMKAPIKVARALVYKFGYVGVLNAMSAEFIANAKKPFGALRHVLEQQQVEPDEQLSNRRHDGIIR